MPLGPNSLQQFVLPSYWDAASIEKYRLADGTTYAALIADIQQALSLADSVVLSDPLYSGLIGPITTDLASEYPVGSTNGFQAHTEYGEPDAKRGATTGDMIPIQAFDRGLGWTWDFLRKARRAQLDADIQSAIADRKAIFQKAVLTRLFKSTYTAVGSTGRAMPLADGGTADSAYVPIANPDRVAAFTNTHTHVVDPNGITQALVQAEVGNLWEHGYDPPYDLLAAAADAAAWVNQTNLTGFVARSDPLIRYGMAANLADVGADYLGVIDTQYGAVRVRVTGRIPTKYWTVYKSFGSLDPRNPLVVRVSPDFGFNAVLMPSSAVQTDPLQRAKIFLEFGVGVANRVGAVVAENDAGAYSIPTII